MTPKNTKLKELPQNTKFATFNSDNEDIILGEYLIATLIFNGASFNNILDCANEIENKKEREEIKDIIINILLNFISLNPKCAEILKQNSQAQEL